MTEEQVIQVGFDSKKLIGDQIVIDMFELITQNDSQFVND